MQAGKLDRRVTLQSRSVTTNAHGEKVVAYADVATVWAQKVETRGREYFAAEQTKAETTTRWRIRWRDGVTSLHRLVYEGEAFDVDHVAELGRRAGLELFTTRKAP